MTKNILQENLTRLIDEGKYKIRRLEMEAGLPTNGIYNIVKGITKSPSFSKLQAIAKVLGTNAETLLLPYSKRASPFLDEADFSIITKITAKMIKSIQELKMNITPLQFSKMFEEIFVESIHISPKEPKDEYIKSVISKHIAR